MASFYQQPSWKKNTRFPQSPSSSSKPATFEFQLPINLAQFVEENTDNESFSSGKYKGYSFEEVFNNDPQYVLWLLKSCRYKSCETDIRNLASWLEKRVMHTNVSSQSNHLQQPQQPQSIPQQIQTPPQMSQSAGYPNHQIQQF